MPRGDKSSYTSKQKRQAAHIEGSYRKRGVSQDEAEERAWRTVNKQTGGAKKKKKKSARKKSKPASGRQRTRRSAKKKSSSRTRRKPARKK